MLSDVPENLCRTDSKRGARTRLSGPHLPSATAIGQYFAGLESASGIVLAVSGGPDSMALLLLAARWRDGLATTAPAIHVATVDHGLRAASHQEAAMVAKAATDLGMTHTILPWACSKPSTRLQERARTARYALLLDHARTLGAGHILTAHHADDQAETVLLRLGRGSGITGLAGIRRVSTLAPGVALVRPLLPLSKEELVAICRADLCDYVDDPSNRDPTFARSRLRAQAPSLAVLGLDGPGLVRLSRRMARADAALEVEVDRVEAGLSPSRGALTYSADLTRTPELAPEIALRLLGRAIAHVAGARAIRLERLEALAEVLWRALDNGEAHRGSLAGTRVVLGCDRHLTISEERPRRRGRGTVDGATRATLRPN